MGFQKFSILLTVVLFSLPAWLGAQPVATVDVQFSDDDGATFNDAITITDGDTFVQRFYFDNTGDAPGTGTSITATLPAGFTRVPSSTTVCLEPTPGEVICNTDAGMGGAIDESTVWSGQDLTISPTAGLLAEAIGATAGILEIGKKRYFNLHECHYFNGATDRFFINADPAIAGTNVSNTLDAAAACAAAASGYGLAGATVRAADLLGHRFLNYHECEYLFLTDRIWLNTDGTATRASNVIDGGANCAGTAGAHILVPAESQVDNVDLLGNRYLNLNECVYSNGSEAFAVNATSGNNTNGSATPDADAVCLPTAVAHSLIADYNIAYDLLDTARGRGYVEVEVTATPGAGDYVQNVAIDGNEFAQDTDMGTVTVMAPVVPGPNATVDLKFSRNGGASFTDDLRACEAETVTVRVDFNNSGDAVGTNASITTDLPAGFTLVPGSTRVCLEPTPGETVCNTDAGMGGAIDETAVWSGQTLSISPSAGLFGEGVDATTGLLEIGRKRYLNFHECQYFNGISDRVFVNTRSDVSGTNVGDTMDADATCAATAFGRTPAGMENTALDLLGTSQLNIHECQYIFGLDRIFINGGSFSGTNTSTVADAAISCAGTAGAHTLLPAESSAIDIDIAGQRYLNFHECVFQSGDDLIGLNAGDALSTNASTDADTVATCPASTGAHTLIDSSLLVLDMLDASRGRGFVEFQAIAGNAGPVDQNVALDATEITTAVDTGQVEGLTCLIFDDGFETGDTSRWSFTLPIP